MSVNLIGHDILLMRDRYDEALEMRGIPAKYQYPIMPTTSFSGESVVDGFSDPEDIHIFFDGNPKVKTLRRYGWVVENSDDLPLLIHCSFHLKNLQKDALFTFAGQYTGVPDRIFRVSDLTYDIQAPDHIICKVVPVYDKQPTGRTDVEIKQTFNKSNHFLKQDVNYRGQYHTTSEDIGKEIK